MGFGIWMFVLGVLAASNLIIARKPEAEELIGKIAPYQGWIGALSALGGVWMVIRSLLYLRWLTVAPIYWITHLITALLLLGLGLLLGIGVLKTFIKDPRAVAKMDQTVAKLVPYQGKLGVASIVVGIWMVLSSIIWRI